VGASAGVLALIEPHVGFHGQLFYSRDSFSRDSGGYSDAVGVAFGFDIFLGG
jgi:hypothetical protein